MYLPPKNRKKLAWAIVNADSSYRKTGQASNVSHTMVAHLIAGRKQSIKDDKALAMCQHLGVNIHDLFVDTLLHEPHQIAARTGTKKHSRKAA